MTEYWNISEMSYHPTDGYISVDFVPRDGVEMKAHLAVADGARRLRVTRWHCVGSDGFPTVKGWMLPRSGEIVSKAYSHDIAMCGLLLGEQRPTRATKEQKREEERLAGELVAKGLRATEVVDELMGLGMSRPTAYRRLRAARDAPNG